MFFPQHPINFSIGFCFTYHSEIWLYFLLLSDDFSTLQVYYKPLKKSEGGAIIESGQVDEIFFQIPEILLNHEYFLEQLNNRAKTWSDKQIIGDIFVSSVCYMLYLSLCMCCFEKYLGGFDWTSFMTIAVTCQ